MSSDLSDIDREVLHNLMDTARALNGNASIAAWNRAVKAEDGETTRAWLKRWKAAR